MRNANRQKEGPSLQMRDDEQVCGALKGRHDRSDQKRKAKKGEREYNVKKIDD
jgi:hypothetical protein